MIVLLNGTAASGKGTLAGLLAEALDLPHYDFGLIFRAIASMWQTLDWHGTQGLIRDGLLEICDGSVVLSGRDLTAELRSEAAGLRAAKLAAAEEMRLVEIAKLLVKHSSFVADGRTVSQIFPYADIHFHVLADRQVAMARRSKEGQDVRLFDERWELDSKRVKLTERSILIETSSRPPDEILRELVDHVRRRACPKLR